MKLFGLPFVPLKEILDNLDINCLFFLALCSKRTKNFIVQTQKYAFQKVDYVQYWTSGQQVTFKLNMLSGEVDTLMYLFDSTDDFTTDPFEFVTLNELGTPIDFLRLTTDTHCSTLQGICNTGDAQLVIEVILKHLLDLIGHHTKFRVMGKFPDGNFVPRFRNIQMSHMVTGADFKSSDMDQFLDRSTSLEYLLWAPLEWKYTPLRENSRLYELDTFHLFTDSSVTSDVMEHFNGRHAFLYAPISTTDVVQFLNAWKSGQKFRNLEVISMDNDTMDSDDFEIPEIGNAVGLKEVSTEVEYSFVRKYPDQLPHQSFRYSWELKARFYMVRESDGHVASVMLTPTRVFMGVWNMTEREFLEKFHNLSNPPLV